MSDPHAMAGRRLGGARKALGWSLQKLATKAKLSERSIRTLQKGQGNVRNYQRACDALGLLSGLIDGNPPGRHLRLAAWGEPPVAGKLRTCPLTMTQANEFVTRWHRHHRPKWGSFKFAIGLVDEHDSLHGAVVASYPTARGTNPDEVLELSRIVVKEGVRNGCSILITAATRIAAEMGYRRCQTFLLVHESGVSLQACGWRFDRRTKNSNWGNRPGRVHDHPGPKQKWVKDLR